MDKDTAHKKAMELLDRVGLKDKADVKPVKTFRRTETKACNSTCNGYGARGYAF